MRIYIIRLLFSAAVIVALGYLFYAQQPIFPLTPFQPITIEEVAALIAATLFLTFVWPQWLEIKKLKKIQKVLAPDSRKLAIFFFLAFVFVSATLLQVMLLFSMRTAVFAVHTGSFSSILTACREVIDGSANRSVFDKSLEEFRNKTLETMEVQQDVEVTIGKRFAPYTSILSPWGMDYLYEPQRFVWLALYWWAIAIVMTTAGRFVFLKFKSRS